MNSSLIEDIAKMIGNRDLGRPLNLYEEFEVDHDFHREEIFRFNKNGIELQRFDDTWISKCNENILNRIVDGTYSIRSIDRYKNIYELKYQIQNKINRNEEMAESMLKEGGRGSDIAREICFEETSVLKWIIREMDKIE